ncbi:MAG: hypothetical protein Q4D81_15395 [Eubacteriales bacterium]|nr:hypothetical protein [Eubacteriales bacterium]
MAVLLTVLKTILILLLVLFLIGILLLLVVLFMPFRYSFSGDIDDPRGSPEVLHLDLKKDVSVTVEIRWLLGAVRTAVSYDGGIRLMLRLFGIPVPEEKLKQLLGGKKKAAGEKKEETPDEKEKPGIEERIDRILTRVQRAYDRADDALYALFGTEYGMRAKARMIEQALHALRKVLPSHWGLTGVLGLGDPARSAGVFSAQGILYPLTAGHVLLDTDYEQYRYDLHWAARGTIRFYVFLFPGIRILFNRDVRRLLTRLRRGPAAERKEKDRAAECAL